jgi:DHA2 family multidrug resistance protein
MIAVGVLGNFASLWLNSQLNASADHAAMLAPIFVRACSLGLLFVPLSVVALSNLSPRQRGAGAGLFNLTRELGGSIGLAWMSTWLTDNQKVAYLGLASRVDVYSPLALDQLRAAQASMAARSIDGQAASYALMAGRLGTQSLIRAFNQSFLTLAFFFLASLLLVGLLKKADPAVKVDPGGHG